MCTKNKKRCKGFTLKYKRKAKDIFQNGDKQKNIKTIK